MFSASAQPGPVCRPPAASRGFTLVELLLVMFVLAILVALVVGVGSYVMEQARINETTIRQQTLVAAMDAYRRATGDFPDDPNVQGDIEGLIRILLAEGVSEDRRREIRKATLPILGSSPGRLEKDAFGNPMRYFSKGAAGGKPLILSAGPDGDFGETDYRKREDNIRSDIQGTAGSQQGVRQQG